MKVLQIGDEVWSVYARENNFLGYYIGERSKEDPWAMFVNNRCYIKLAKLMGYTRFESVMEYK